MSSILSVAINAVLTLVGADPIEFSDVADAACTGDGPDPGTIGPATDIGTTNGGD